MKKTYEATVSLTRIETVLVEADDWNSAHVEAWGRDYGEGVHISQVIDLIEAPQ